MHYINIEDPEIQYTFSDTVRLGLPFEHGSFMPNDLPKLGREFVENLRGLSLADIAQVILPHFAPELSSKQIREICLQAFNPAYFIQGEAQRTQALNDYQGKLLFSFLDRGPTASYQDLLVRFQMACLDQLADKANKWLVAAGPDLAELKALASLLESQSFWTPVFVGSDYGLGDFDLKELKSLWQLPSKLQEQDDPKALFRIKEENRGQAVETLSREFVAEILTSQEQYDEAGQALADRAGRPELTGDQQADHLVSGPTYDISLFAGQTNRKDYPVYLLKGKAVAVDRALLDLAANFELRSALAEQATYLTFAGRQSFSAILLEIILIYAAYSSLLDQGLISLGDRIDLAVAGPDYDWLLAGLLAKETGLPLADISFANNNNRAAHEFLQNGNYNSRRRQAKTNTPAAERLYSENFGRLAYYLSGNNSKVTANFLEKIRQEGRAKLSVDRRLKQSIRTCQRDNKKVNKTLKDYYRDYDYMFDPLTGLALTGLSKQLRRPVLVPVLESPLLSLYTVARAAFSDKFIRGKAYNQLLNITALEIGLPVPASAYSGKDLPQLVKIKPDELPRHLLQGQDQAGQSGEEESVRDQERTEEGTELSTVTDKEEV